MTNAEMIDKMVAKEKANMERYRAIQNGTYKPIEKEKGLFDDDKSTGTNTTGN